VVTAPAFAYTELTVNIMSAIVHLIAKKTTDSRRIKHPIALKVMMVTEF
jgi:hypothetical protein